MTNRKLTRVCFLLFVVLTAGCAHQQQFKIASERYRLDNGLEVILHTDKSDPISAVAIQYHVGSNREVPGRTGFAHLFEHMMFQESQHVGQDQFFRNIQAAGGTLNGGTSRDGTTYYEVVPKNVLEMVLWMEADRMGFLLSRVTQESLVNQQNVVQNEKRQGVDNRPYGHTSYVINKLLYPEGHPYNWQVIGSMEDLSNATLKDVHQFHRKWYCPNNATLVIAGDFDRARTMAWIEKYFGEIPAGEAIIDPKPVPVKLTQTKRAFHADNLAKAPELNMVFPTVEEYHKDMYALDMLGDLFARGKKSPLYKVIVEQRKLAPDVRASNRSGEVAGTFQISIRAFPGVNLTDVENAVKEACQRFEAEKFTQADLQRIKTQLRSSFFRGLSSVLGKSFTLAQYNEYAGSPEYLDVYIRNLLSVTSDDIWRVYRQYVRNKPYVLTSFVPKGGVDLVAKGSERFPIKEESVENQAEVKVVQGRQAGVEVKDIPSRFDRGVEPSQGPTPLMNVPKVWQGEMSNGVKVYGIEYRELPLVEFMIHIRGGMLLDEPGKEGQAYLMGRLLTEGTKNRTPIQLEEAIDELGADINVRAGREAVTVSASCLVSELDKVVALVREVLLEPRWDQKEFARIKEETIESLRRSKDNPASVAGDVFDKLVYGRDHKLACSARGTESSVQSMTIDDLVRYYKANLSPSVAHIAIAGDLSRTEALKVLGRLESWERKDVTLPELPEPKPHDKTQLYFVDFPGAQQSQLCIGHLALPYAHPDFFGTKVMNYKLGGSFNSVLNMILREEKGYTYGARSGFSGSLYPGLFAASSSVRSTATLDSVRIVRDEMAKYREGISDQDLQFTKDALIKSNTRRFEVLGALVGMLDEIATYNLAFDYVQKEERIVLNMTLDEHRKLARQYIQPDKMVYLVVGDAKTQMQGLTELGLGTPVLLDKEANVVGQPASQL